jgi:hypothetical protein
MYRLTTWHYPPQVPVDKSAVALDAKSWERLIKPVREHNPQAPEALAELIERCLAYHPAQRPERMSDVKDILEALAANAGDAPDDFEEAFR